jgi:hypothetical protein
MREHAVQVLDIERDQEAFVWMKNAFFAICVRSFAFADILRTVSIVQEMEPKNVRH